MTPERLKEIEADLTTLETDVDSVPHPWMVIRAYRELLAEVKRLDAKDEEIADQDETIGEFKKTIRVMTKVALARDLRIDDLTKMVRLLLKGAVGVSGG